MALLPVHYEKVRRYSLTTTQQAKLQGGVALYGYEWTHSNFDWFKDFLKARLRTRQRDRCCYCRRRLLFDKGLVEIEHVIDKGAKISKYSRFTFEVGNLALACKDCNNNKGKKKVLAKDLQAADPYPVKASEFLWVHPYLHNYSEHIYIHQSWVYEAKNASPEGLKVIQHCMLDKLRDKERSNRRVIVSGAADYRQAILQAAAFAGEVGLDNICKELGARLSTKWKAGNSAEVEQAIRDAYHSVR